MRTIIAGGRDIETSNIIEIAIEYAKEHDINVTSVVSGNCPTGIDRLGEIWAIKNNLELTLVPAEWSKHGKAAGPIRNRVMAREKNAEALIAIWDGKSRGTKNMIDEATEANLKVCIFRITPV